MEILSSHASEFLVMGDAATIAQAIDASPAPFYVYILLRPNGEPFYVGKGVRKRVLQHEAEARCTVRRTHKLNVIRAIHRAGLVVRYAIASFFNTETEAHACERRLIFDLGRHDLGRGPLTNQTDGGEGTSNPSEESRTRRAATLGGEAEDPDRRVANELFHSIAGKQNSVPVKPLGALRLEPTTPHVNARGPTRRMAVTLVVAGLSAETPLKAGAVLPRVFAIDGKFYAIENGVAKDMLKAGVIAIEPGAKQPQEERFLLTPFGFSDVVKQIGRNQLLSLGAIDP